MIYCLSNGDRILICIKLIPFRLCRHLFRYFKIISWLYVLVKFCNGCLWLTIRSVGVSEIADVKLLTGAISATSTTSRYVKDARETTLTAILN